MQIRVPCFTMFSKQDNCCRRGEILCVPITGGQITGKACCLHAQLMNLLEVFSPVRLENMMLDQIKLIYLGFS